MLSTTGGTLEYGGEPIEPEQQLPMVAATDFMTTVSILLLGGAGYLLVRHVRLETARDVGLAFGTATVSYVVLAVGLATLARWSPEEVEPAPGEVNGPNHETLAVAVDTAMVLTATLSVALFFALGGVVAALPRLLEYAPVGTTRESLSE
jgi:hypothetical protein